MDKLITFDAYCAGTGKTDTAIAEELSCSKAYVGQLRAENKTPSLAMAERISAWSEGAVSHSSWLAEKPAIE